MTKKHHFSLPVRYYECDAYSHVNHANYIRFMGEAANSAAAEVGDTRESLAAIERAWIAREHKIEFLTPLRFGDTVNIQTWVADFRRIRSLRRYDIFANDTLAARASTDWIFVNTANGYPNTISEDIEQRFRALNYDDSEAIERDNFPRPAPQAENVGNVDMHVEWRDIDANHHVNNASYFSYIENGTMRLCEEQYDWSFDRMIKAGFAVVARKYRLEHRKPAVMGDILRLKTWISDIRGATAVRHYELSRVRDGQLCAKARCMWVWVDIHTQKPIRIPKGFLADFASNISP